MAAKIVNTNLDLELAPGKSKTLNWNNAKPANAVWSANAIPLPTGDTAKGFNQDTQLEVTRLWRRFKVVEKSTTQFSDTDIETEIWYTVKNVGTKKARFNVYLSAIY